MRVDVTTWSLEITDPSQLRAAAGPPVAVELREAAQPSPEFARFLYTAAGGNWFWCDRLLWTHEQWVERLSNARVETHVAYVDGTPAGYFELDGSVGEDVEIAYLGVVPTFIGRRLGGWMLTAAIRRGWAMGVRRVWVHTCSLDAQPQALKNYQARGMRIFKEVVGPVELPDMTPGPWPGAGVRGPHAVIEEGEASVKG